MNIIEIRPGAVVKYDGREFVITRICDIDSVIIENSAKEIEKVKVSKLEPTVSPSNHDVTTIKDHDWEIAQERFSIIQPILRAERQRELVKSVSKERGIGESTIYRWISIYTKTNLVSSLAPAERTGGKGKSRLTPELDKIIKKVIDEHYLDDQRKSIQKVCVEVRLECKARGLEAPHYNTLRHRIGLIRGYDSTKYRLGRRAAREKYDPKVGSFPDAVFPLSSVQIDHTPLDIIVVDEKLRTPIGRPWLTLAIDTYSRMIVGQYISFERPSAMSVGLCVAHSILPKEEWLAQRDTFSAWPCWGVIKCIHVDNAKEFHSAMLLRACMEYGIEIDWRPVKRPEFGGIIERMLGTLATEIHSLGGTTFSTFEERGDYDSEAKATMTLKELEQWLGHLIIDVYHNRYHSEIQMSPLAKWKGGLLGNDQVLGVGLPPRITNSRKVHLDFMPFEERTIQDYGVMVDNICYYNDVLRRWINSIDSKSGRLKAKRKFIFKRDPRDISIIYFLDPELNEYFPITYRDTSKPSITIWEFRAAREKVIQDGLATVDEDTIFRAYSRMKEIEQNSWANTKRAKRLESIREKQIQHRAILMPSSEYFTVPRSEPQSSFVDEIIEAFEDIDDGTSD